MIMFSVSHIILREAAVGYFGIFFIIGSSVQFIYVPENQISVSLSLQASLQTQTINASFLIRV